MNSLSIAPMMKITHLHFRQLLRLITPHCELYTEMVSAGAILYNAAPRPLRYTPNEQPLILQIGDSNPDLMGKAVEKLEGSGYDGLNLNAGCPSDKVQKGLFGAALMRDIDRCVRVFVAMQERSSLPVSIKCRLGAVERREEASSVHYDGLCEFVRRLSEAGCLKFIVHARVAILQGISTKENREIPPLRYEMVYRLKEEFPSLEIGINGGVKTPQEVQEHLRFVDEVMVGRTICDNPWRLAEWGEILGFTPEVSSRHELVKKYLDYLERYLCTSSTPDTRALLLQPLFDLYTEIPGVRKWRRGLSEILHQKGSEIGDLPRSIELLHDSLF